MLPRSFRSVLILGVFSFTFAGVVGAETPTPPPPPSLDRDLGSGTTIDAPDVGPNHTYVSAKVLTKEAVSYPELARLNRVEGVVRVRFSVDENGQVQNVFAEKSGGSVMLDQVVLDPHLKKWTFKPATLDGKPISAVVVQEFEFKLDPNQQRALAIKRLALPVGIPDPPYPADAAAHGLKGRATIGIFWDKTTGLVDKIYLVKSSGFGLLDATALRFAFENWRTEAAKVTDERFVKTVDFGPQP